MLNFFGHVSIICSIHTSSSYNIYIWYSSLKGSFEVAIESSPGWDLNPQPLNSAQTL